MVSAINFGTTANNNSTLKSSTSDTPKNSVVTPKEECSKGIIQTSIGTISNIRKGWNILSTGTKGAFKAIGGAFVAGGSVMSIDWLIQRLSGNGVEGQSILTTPLKTAWNIVAGVTKKVAKIFAKDTSFREVLAYPIIGFPKDVYNYVKNAKGGSKAGKGIAIAIGLAALVLSIFKTVVTINTGNAEIDHKYKTGHNAQA